MPGAESPWLDMTTVDGQSKGVNSIAEERLYEAVGCGIVVESDRLGWAGAGGGTGSNFGIKVAGKNNKKKS